MVMLIYIWDLSAENHKCALSVGQTEQQKRNAYLPGRWTDMRLLFCGFGGRSAQAELRSVATLRQNVGFQRVPLWHTTFGTKV